MPINHSRRFGDPCDTTLGNPSSSQVLHRNWLYEQSLRYMGPVLLALAVTVLPTTGLRAEGAGIIAPGDAVITGFSGIVAPDAPPPPDRDPLDYFYIDLDGTSAQIMRLGVPGGPPEGQMISVPTPHRVKARDIGQVFGIALDDDRVPSIYLAATAAFGLRIVGEDANGDGRPDRLKTGRPGAGWMAGQFGSGGPGAIYRIDGETGEVDLFATIPGNGGAGLGNIVFDKSNRQFFVSDLDTGLIHRLGADGMVIDNFDHGTTGRTTAVLDAILDDGSRIELSNPAFDTENPDTWGFTQPERRVWGMAVYRGRLYYAIADGPSVWSVSIEPDGSFGGDPRLEIEVTDAPDGSAISDITFDGQGRIYLAQRGAIRGSYDYSVFAEPERSAVLRYARVETDGPATPGGWTLEPQSYAIGLAPEHRNAAGGIALGYGHDRNGMARRGACHATLWTTGDNLRNDPAQAHLLGDEGPLDIHGMQGNDISLVRPQNDPPLQSYFVDYDGQFGDTGKAGHVGDIEIWQPCEGTPEFGGLYPGYPPPGYLPPDFGAELPPERRRRTNLKLDKRAVSCWKIGGDKHRCGYLVTVTNTGPHIYNAHIRVRDQIPAGTTAHFSSPLFTCGPGAPNYTCQSNAPIVLHPWEKVTIPVRVDVPDTLAKPLNCRVRNRARITFAPGGSRRNFDPTDDADAATAFLPPHLCKEPPKEKTNLRLTKRPLSCFKIDGGKIRCAYHVRVWNTGPGDYHDKIEVNESVPVGVTAHFSGPPTLGWNCAGGNPYTCTSNPVFLAPGNNALLIARLDITQEQAKQWNCKLRNTARLIYAPGGSDQNTNPADDAASAAAIIPAEICTPPQSTNLKLTKLSAQVGCNVTGANQWRCVYNVLVRNMGPGHHSGPITVQDWVPAHPAGATMTFQAPWNCVGGGTNYDCTHPPVDLAPGQQVVLQATVFVPPGHWQCHLQNMARIKSPLGAPKNTDASDDQDWATADFAPMIVDGKPYCHTPVPAQCPPGFAWMEDRCARGPVIVPPPQVCPPGTAGRYPDCRKPPVVVDPPRCKPGTIGRYPNCRPIVRPCPRGTVGKWPNCKKPPVVVDPPRCKPGTIGRYPNCRPIVRPCPRGTVGKWPNCRKVERPKCPSGMVGRPPNCRKIVRPHSSIAPQRLRQWKAPTRVGPSRPLPRPRVR